MLVQPTGWLVAAGLALATTLSAERDLALAPDPEITVVQDQARRTLTAVYGPVDVPAGVGYEGELVTISAEFELPVDGWLRSFELALTGADGTRVREPILHHAGLFSPGKRDLFSPAMERIVAFGQETEAIALPGQLGYRIQPGDTILLLGALYNTTATGYESLELRLDMVYADARRDVVHTDVLPLYLDVMPPGNRVYEIPPGRSSRSLEWSPAIDGRILALGGHLHQYGTALVLEDVTAGDTIWVGTASHDENDELLGVSRKIYLRGERMRADHVYRITAIYDNPTDEPIGGAMGKIGGVFLPDRGEEMPPVDRMSEEYLRDWHAMAEHEHELEHVRAAEQSSRGGVR